LRRRIVSVFVAVILFAGVFELAIDIKPVKASATICIRSDGSIDPPTAPILTFDNMTYTLTSNINETLLIQRDNIVFNGGGFSIQGAGEAFNGIEMWGRSNVTVKNVKIIDTRNAMFIADCDSSFFVNNTFVNSAFHGLLLQGLSSFNYMLNNTALYNYIAIALTDYTNCSTVAGNNISDNDFGIYVHYSHYNTICHNMLFSNREPYDGFGIGLYHAFHNEVFQNTALRNIEGFRVYGGSTDNRFFHNSFINNSKQVSYPSWSQPGGNCWNDSYPSGGNYWSNYSGTDIFSGPYQNLTGSDGIGDTPYIIDANNTDYYPLMTTFPLLAWDITGPTMWVPDGKCDIRDVALIALHFGSVVGDGKYDVRADITGPIYLVRDGKIDIRDVALVAIHFGEEYM